MNRPDRRGARIPRAVLLATAMAACADDPLQPGLDGAPPDVAASPTAVFRGIDPGELDRLDRESELGHPSDGEAGLRLRLLGGFGDRGDGMVGMARATGARESNLDNDGSAASVSARRQDLDIPEVCHRNSPALDFQNGRSFDDGCNALLAARDQLRGTVALNWDTATVMTEWDGVVLGRFRVEKLYLHNRGLDGSLPPELGVLTDLEVLSLGRNRLTGEIPPELGSMRDLERLYLQDNRLTGGIPPELGALRNLERLYLWRNRLTGGIPPELGALRQNLERLDLWGNELTGPIPSELGRLYYIQTLSLSQNRLTGEIPPALADLRYIKALLLDGNELTGPIPTSDRVLAWENVEVLWLDGNDLSGPAPAALGDTDLHSLAISNNAGLTGPLPLELQSLILDAFHWDGTALCSPDDPSFQAWLASIAATDGDSYSGGPVCDSDSGNRAPETVGSIPARTLKPGESATVDASDYFRDPDGDALTYAARSTSSGVATVAVSEGEVTVTAVADGSATIRVTARDPGGLTAEQAFEVTVAGDGGGDYKTLTGLTITMSGALKWGNLTNTGCVGGRVTINGVSYEVHWTEWQRRDNTAGSAWAQVSGTRKNGQLCGYDLSNAPAGVYRFVGEFTVGGVRGKYRSENEVTVGGDSGNRAPETVGSIPARTLKPGESATVDAVAYFRDPDGDALTYTARSSSAGVATVAVSDSAVTVTAVADGSATIRVTARDPGGLTAEQAFDVTVAGDGDDDYKTLTGLTITASGALKWSNLTNTGCLGPRVLINGVTYEAHWTEWQRRDRAAGSAWAQVSGTRKNGQLCGYDLSNAPAGVYRFVGEFTVGGVRGKYKSENEITK